MTERDERSHGQLSLGGTLGDAERADRDADDWDEDEEDADADADAGADADADAGADADADAGAAGGAAAEPGAAAAAGPAWEQGEEQPWFGDEEGEVGPEVLGGEEQDDEEAGADEDDADEPEERKTATWPRVQDAERAAPGATLAPRQSLALGAVLGAAIGDAIGHPTEFINSLEAIRAKYGPRGVTGFELYWERDGARFAPYTDDTQMAEVVLRSLLESREADEDLDAAMARMGRGFVDWADHPQGGHRAPGNACLAGCRALARGVRWSAAGGATAGGCGSVMRAYPFGLIFADEPRRAERWAAAHSRLTHGDPIALAASAAMAAAMAAVARGAEVDAVLSAMVGAACRHCANTTAMIARAIHEARTGVAPEVVLQRLQAWAAHEAIAAAAYLFARHPDDPAAAILEGANTPGDSDSIATLAGALVGGRCGVAALPARWVADVERSAELRALALRI